MHRVAGGSYNDLIDGFEVYADLLLEHKALGFEDPLYLTPEQHGKVLLRLFDFDLCRNVYSTRGASIWTDNTYENLSPAGRLTEDKDPLDCMKSNWHADCVEYKRPVSYLSMSMLEYDCPEGQGDTVLVNLEDLYEKCPYKEYLEDLNLAHPAKGGVQIDESIEAQIHPALRTLPVTGKTSLCISDSRMLPIGASKDALGSGWGAGLDPAAGIEGYGYMGSDEQPEFVEYMQWIHDQINDPENQQWFRWEEGNFLIWDNRCNLHSFSGWMGPRSFNRGLVGMDAVWYGGKRKIDIMEEENAFEVDEKDEIHFHSMSSPEDLAESRTKPGGGYED